MHSITLSQISSIRSNNQTSTHTLAQTQAVPGKVQLAYYDLGGPDVAYHSYASQNFGSCSLNPCDGQYKNVFRKARPSPFESTLVCPDPRRICLYVAAHRFQSQHKSKSHPRGPSASRLS